MFNARNNTMNIKHSVDEAGVLDYRNSHVQKRGTLPIELRPAARVMLVCHLHEQRTEAKRLKPVLEHRPGQYRHALL